MLTGYQCETIAYMTDGGIICQDCAIARTSTLTIEKIDRGLTSSADDDIRPLIRYSVDEIIGEYASERADEVCDWKDAPDEWQEAFDNAPDFYSCDDCGNEIS